MAMFSASAFLRAKVRRQSVAFGQLVFAESKSHGSSFHGTTSKVGASRLAQWRSTLRMAGFLIFPGSILPGLPILKQS
jgi:hypothetical protein